MTELEIIRGCKANDRKAQRAFVDKYTRYVYAICRRYVNDGEKAKDCMQEALMQVLNKIDKYEETGSFKSWVASVTVRKTINIMRSEKRFAASDLENVEEPLVAENVSYKLELDDVKEFMETLPERYRIVINMFIMEGYSHKEIGEHLGLEEGSSRAILSRARKLIMEKFKTETRSMNEGKKENKIVR